MLHRSSLLSFTILVSLAACGKKNDVPTPTPMAPAPAPTPAPTPAPSQAITAVVEGSACAAGTQLVTDAPITIAGATASFTRGRGGGCPTKAVYTLLYTKASPTEIRICFDPAADVCEMFIPDERVSFDLSAPLKASGATAAVLGK